MSIITLPRWRQALLYKAIRQVTSVSSPICIGLKPFPNCCVNNLDFNYHKEAFFAGYRRFAVRLFRTVDAVIAIVFCDSVKAR